MTSGRGIEQQPKKDISRAERNDFVGQGRLTGLEEGAIKGERGQGKEGYGWCRFAETVRAHGEGLRGVEGLV